MTSLPIRLAQIAVSCLVLGLAGAASAQTTLSITDTTTTKATACTASSVTGSTVTFTPNGCLGLGTSPGSDPVFTLRLVPSATTQPTTGVAVVEVFVDADKDVPTTTTYNLSLNLCTSAQLCTTASSGSWYFIRYAELGGAGFLPKDQVTTGTFSFAFQRGANTGTTPNLRSMGIGRLEIPATPAFSSTRSVMLSLAGAQASTTVATHTITGSQTPPAPAIEGDKDIYGNTIPDPTASPGSYGCEQVGNPPTPGSGPGPCGSYAMYVNSPYDAAVNCSNEMNAGSEITNAWHFNWSYAYGSITSFRIPLQPRHALSFRFKTPTVEEAVRDGKGAGWFPHNGTATILPNSPQRGSDSSVHITLSDKRCEFRRAAFVPATYDACNKTSNTASATISYTLLGNTTDPDPPYTCTLRPGTYYYMNIRFENVTQNPGVTGCVPTGGATTCGIEVAVN